MYNYVPNKEFSDVYQINKLNWLISEERTIENKELEDIIKFGIEYIDQILEGAEIIKKTTDNDFESYNLLSNNSLQSLDRAIIMLNLISDPKKNCNDIKEKIESQVLKLKSCLVNAKKKKKIKPCELKEVKKFFNELLAFQIKQINKNNKFLKEL
ncbi:MAG: hypothetical protein K9W44_01845 [Candidatus Lokiarchaeota archaeon]|nr:hypothetical protein [Candidatus Harpocratesius repetitus]